MSFGGWIRKVLGIVDKRVDYMAAIFAAVLLAGNWRLTEEVRTHIEEDAAEIFKSKTLQTLFSAQVAYYYNGASKGTKDLNLLVKIINRNNKLHPKWNRNIPYELLNNYRSEDVEQKRLFEFLHTIKPDI